MAAKISDDQLIEFSEFVAQTVGLHFPRPRWPELQRGIAAAARALGMSDIAECMTWLMATPLTKDQLEALAINLTVGETYFLREKRSFEVFAEEIIPALIRVRQNGARRLRIWSAACCTGEEAYSIAILLQRTIPDLQDWDVTLLATDINPQFLRKAENGKFGQWSFRDTPVWLKDGYFKATAGGKFEIIPEIKRMVSFAQLNLAEDGYPSSVSNTEAMDVIFCRNVLMYFTAPRAKRVIENLYRAQVDGGWLIVAPSELLHVSSSPYKRLDFPGATLHQKSSQRHSAKEKPRPDATAPPTIKQPPTATVASRGTDADIEAPHSLRGQPHAAGKSEPAKYSDVARSLANEGKLAEALSCCDQWIAADKLDPSSHYLRAVILQEQGAIEQAIGSLRKALYLDPNFTLAHFALGNIARQRGQGHEADKHLANTLKLLRAYPVDQILPESEGITAGRLTEIVRSLMNAEAVS